MYPRLRKQSTPTPRSANQCASCIGRSLNICRPLNDKQLTELLALGGPKSWRKRDILFRAGDPISDFFKITKGVVAVSKTLEDGRRQIVALRIAGDCVGYLHTDGRYTFEGHAITDVEACTFSRHRFDDLAWQYPELAAATAEALAKAHRQANQSIMVMGQLRSQERVAYFLAEIHALYESRFGEMESISLHMNRTEIADYTGLTIETISRTIAKLKKRGLIALLEGNGDAILNLQGLQQFGKFER